MTAIDGCKHTLAKSAVPVCLDCYKELQTILAEARQYHATLEHSFAMAEQSEQRALQQLQQAREALEKYGQHLPTCQHQTSWAGARSDEQPPGCTCGFAASLAGGTDG